MVEKAYTASFWCRVEAMSYLSCTPKALFPKPRPSDLVTIPACCENCNNSTSAYDDRFAMFVTGKVAERAGDQDVVDFFNNKKIRGMGRDTYTRKRLINDSKMVELTTVFGKFIEHGWAIPWDHVAERIVAIKLVKGLFYHHYNEILAPDVPIETKYYNSLPKGILEEINKNMDIASVGKDKFVYARMRIGNNSLWIFQFFKKHWTGAVTGNY